MSDIDLIKKLYSGEIVSKCCKNKFFVQHGNEGTSYYVCKKCGKACDTCINQNKCN